MSPSAKRFANFFFFLKHPKEQRKRMEALKIELKFLHKTTF